MPYENAKGAYAKYGIDTDKAIEKLKSVSVSLHCWQGDDVRGFDTDPEKPLTGGIQTTGNYPGRARTPEELMRDIDKVISLVPGKVKLNLHASYAIFDKENPWVDRDKIEPKHFAFNARLYFFKIIRLGQNIVYGFFVSHSRANSVGRNILKAVAGPNIHNTLFAELLGKIA